MNSGPVYQPLLLLATSGYILLLWVNSPMKVVFTSRSIISAACFIRTHSHILDFFARAAGRKPRLYSFY